jgi:hypothetical protein
MRKVHWLAISALLAVVVSGCGKPVDTGVSATTSNSNKDAVKTDAVAKSDEKLSGPAAAIHEFLEALRTGNDEKASKMLSSMARKKTAALNRSVTPPASDTARFTIGKVDYVNEDGARVACTWTDVDETGQPRTDEAVWVLRREEGAWHVAGVAAIIFPGEPPLLLNFEDPDDMFRKQQWVREEIRRRVEAGGLQAKSEEKQAKPLRR